MRSVAGIEPEQRIIYIPYRSKHKMHKTQSRECAKGSARLLSESRVPKQEHVSSCATAARRAVVRPQPSERRCKRLRRHRRQPRQGLLVRRLVHSLAGCARLHRSNLPIIIGRVAVLRLAPAWYPPNVSFGFGITSSSTFTCLFR